MERSAEIIALDKDLLSAIRKIEVTRYVNQKDVHALYERCQKIIRTIPDYSHFYASVPNDFAHLPVDVILDVISISQPFTLKRRFVTAIEADSFFVGTNFLNMAKIDGRWGEEARKLESFTYGKGVIKRTFFDSHGEMKSEEVEATALGRNMVRASHLGDRHNIQDIADNFNDELRLEVSAESLHLKQLMKPRFTSIAFDVLDTNSALEEFVSNHLKSKILRKLQANYGHSNATEIGSSWSDQLAQFVLRDDFLELDLNIRKISVFTWQILEGAYNKWRTTSSVLIRQRTIKFRVTEEDVNECEEFFGRFEHEINGDDQFVLEHPDKSGRMLTIQCTTYWDETNDVQAWFSVAECLQEQAIY